MANKIILTADSTCDLNKELIERYSVNTFPLHISLGDQMYDDWVTITPDEIYDHFNKDMDHLDILFSRL